MIYQLFFFVPASHLETVKAALFAVGAGKLGQYEHCCWQVLGQGQFKPLAGSSAFIGAVDQLSEVQEYRVELICPAAVIDAAVAALQAAHPYETPAYGVVPLQQEYSIVE